MSKERKHDSEFIKEFSSKLNNEELVKTFNKIVGGSKEDGLFIRAIDKKQVDENIDLVIENVELLKNIAKEYNIENSSLFKTIENEANIIKKTCKELGLTYVQLGEAIGVKEQSLRNMSSSNKITEQVEKSINLLIENYELKEQLKDCNILKEALKNLIK
ncbi:hypothetical protein ACOTVM_00755 [Aliarcobacter butzleri]